MILTPEELVRVRAQAEAEYPAECCGVLLVRSAPAPDRALMPCRNIQDELHAQDPVRHPRNSRTAYFIDPKDLLAIGRRESQGYRVAVEAPDVKGMLDELEDQFGGLKGLVRNDQGEVHHHVNIYVNNEAIEALQGLGTTLKDG
ncbi:MAG TPA: hypothetical protein VK746_15735, partial [Candidatus Eisenbacteria bacterium]|nr:hypothetical protein [Candidatus Eisenbacteria bacterium]